MTNNFSQFFYKKIIDGNKGLVRQLEKTSEFKLMFDHLFPMKRYMALAFIYAGDGLSKFIPEPTAVLQETKSVLRSTLTGLINSDNYTYKPDPLAKMLENDGI